MREFRVFLCILGSGVFAAAAQEPNLEVIVPERDARVGQAYTLSYEVSWLGDARDFAVMPPEFEPVKWGDATVGEAVSALKGNTFTVTQSLEVVPREAGQFSWPAVTIAYPNPGAATPQENEITGANPPDPGDYPTLRAQSLPILVRPPSIVPWISSGLGAFLVFSTFAALIVYTRRSRAVVVAASAPSDGPAIEEVLHRARRHRLDGQYYEYFTALIWAVESAEGNTGSDLRNRLKSRAHEVGFGGARPTEDELDGVFRDVERALASGPASESQG